MKTPGSKGFKITMAAIGLIVAAPFVIGGVAFLVDSASTTDDEIRGRFDCGRFTADYRTTDEYCNNPELYREHIDNPSECLAKECSAL